MDNTALDTSLPLYGARVLADSISPDGVRLTTLVVNMPRFVLAELNTHRMFSRNSASSRAIPVERRIAMIGADPVVPEAFSKNRPGMQADENLDEDAERESRWQWLRACAESVARARNLAAAGVHKQHANRLLEPFSPHTVIISATEWENYFALRCHPAAQPEIQRASYAMRDAMAASAPAPLGYDEWHLPLVMDDERDESRSDFVRSGGISGLIRLSIARCARVSYLTHDGKRDPAADLKLYERLASMGHMSPLEHAARPMRREDVAAALGRLSGVICEFSRLDPAQHYSGNFRGWMQYRKTLAGEAVFRG